MNYINLLYNNVYFVRKKECVLLYAKSKLIYVLPKTPTKKPQPPFSDAKNPNKNSCQKPEQKLLKVYQKSAKNLLPYLHPKNFQCSFDFGVFNPVRYCYTESEILFPILGNMVRAFINHIDKNPVIGVDHII